MEKVENFLKKTIEMNLFYKNIVEQNDIYDISNITLYPMLTRIDLQRNKHNIFSDGYKSLYYAQQLRKQSSSGTSGVPVCVYWDYRDFYASMRILWRKRLSYYGIHPLDKIVKFTLNSITIDDVNGCINYVQESNNVLNINFSTVYDKKDYYHIIKILREFSPKWLYIQPFILQKLIDAYKYFDLEPPPTISYIESVGELLPSELKENAKKFFNAPLANLYGSEEMNGIAYECPFHQMHVLTDNVFVECRDVKGIHPMGEGEAIITNLVNKAMPLIRYNQGDIINLKYLSKTCPCGSDEPVISIIKGRIYENIKIGNQEINPFMLMSILSNINNQYSGIMTCYHYLYIKSRRKLICFIELDEHHENWFINVRKKILSKLISELDPSCGISIDVLKEKTSNFKKKQRILEIIN